MGIYVEIEKLSETDKDEELAADLGRRGITRLPALISPDGKPFIGVQSITQLLSKNINRINNNERCAPGRGEASIGTNTDLSKYWEQNLYDGTDKKGRRKARKDTDDELDAEDGPTDFDRRMREYDRHKPKHHGGGKQAEKEESDDDSDDEPAPRKKSQKKSRRHAVIDDDDEDDNIMSMAGPGDDQMDDKMLAAWMDKSGADF